MSSSRVASLKKQQQEESVAEASDSAEYSNRFVQYALQTWTWLIVCGSLHLAVHTQWIHFTFFNEWTVLHKISAVPH